MVCAFAFSASHILDDHPAERIADNGFKTCFRFKGFFEGQLGIIFDRIFSLINSHFTLWLAHTNYG